MRIVAIGREIDYFELKRVEGQPVAKGTTGKELLVGRSGLLVEVRHSKGAKTTLHSHTHESFCYIVEGKVRVTVGNDTWVLGPGDAFLHPEGVLHTSEMLEDCTWIEFKTSPEKTWE